MIREPLGRRANFENSHVFGYLGADWWGSDARAVAMEFRNRGHLVIERHYEDYLSTKWRGLSLRVLRRLAIPYIGRDYNRAVEELLSIKALEFLLVFKGRLLNSTTLKKFRECGVPCYLLYPDVSFKDHDKNIWECLPLYDCIFTTKSFHLADMSLRNRVKEMKFVMHGYDPDVHRPINPNETLLSAYGCDVSFVGCWSEKKESLLRAVIDECSNVEIDIWGPNWDRAQSQVRDKWRGRAAYGDELVAIYACSKINLGLLSEAGTGFQAGDRTTARSWQIPASGGFILHEDTDEIREHFQAGKEIGLFSDSLELVSKIRRFLGDGVEREKIRMAGLRRCVSAPYTYAPAVTSILEHHRSHDKQIAAMSYRSGDN